MNRSTVRSAGTGRLAATALAAAGALVFVAGAATTAGAASGSAGAPAADSTGTTPATSGYESRGALLDPTPFTATQPDGTKITLRGYGDGLRNGFETLQGNSVVQGADKVWRYAGSRDAAGQLVASMAVVGKSAAPAVSQKLRPSQDLVVTAQDIPLGSTPSVAQAGPIGIGGQKSLVILASFANRGPVGSTEAQWAAKYFGASGSVAAYYRKASFGKFNLTPAAETFGTANNGVVGWVNLGYNHPNPQSTNPTAARKIARDAIAKANPYVNFAAFDTNKNGIVESKELHVTVIVAGYETSYGGAAAQCGPSVWGHMSTLTGTSAIQVDGKYVGSTGYTEFGEWHCVSSQRPGHMATIGIMAHEIGHDIGWPDLYDIDLSGEGIGRWSLMASGSWGAATGAYPGSSPALPDAFSKYYQRWITPTVITGSPTSRTIAYAEGSTPTNTAYLLGSNPYGVDWSWYSKSGKGEYFLVENRQRTSYDVSLPGCGILVYHIDETRTYTNAANATNSRKLVDIEEASGTNPLDRAGYRGSASDTWPGSLGRKVFSASSTPNSRFYSGADSGSTMTVTSTACSTSMTAALG